MWFLVSIYKCMCMEMSSRRSSLFYSVSYLKKDSDSILVLSEKEKCQEHLGILMAALPLVCLGPYARHPVFSSSYGK